MDLIALLLSLLTLVAGAALGYVVGRRRAASDAGRQARTDEQLAL